MSSAMYEDDHRSPSMPQLLIPLAILSILLVGIRFWSRAISPTSGRRSRLWWDDWLALIDLPFVLAQISLIMYWNTIGLGKHISKVPYKDVKKGLLILYIYYFLWNMGLALSKLSVLCFFSRIFKTDRQSRIALWTITALVIAWEMAAFCSALWQCTPIGKAWNPSMPGQCIHFYPWWLGIAITSVIIDLAILLLPMPFLWQLQLSLCRKLFISFIFVCGYAIIGVSIGRLVAVHQAGAALVKDYTYNIVPVGYWVIVENPISLISICLPNLYTFVNRAYQYGPGALLSSKRYDSMRSSDNGTQSVVDRLKRDRPFKNRKVFNDSEAQLCSGNPQATYHAMASSDTYPVELARVYSGPGKRIRVRDEVEVRESTV